MSVYGKPVNAETTACVEGVSSLRGDNRSTMRLATRRPNDSESYKSLACHGGARQVREQRLSTHQTPEVDLQDPGNPLQSKR